LDAKIALRIVDTFPGGLVVTLVVHAAGVGDVAGGEGKSWRYGGRQQGRGPTAQPLS
jgi:hypothetical protein